MRPFWKLIRGTAELFAANNGPRLAAALSYYTTSSLAPLLLILLGVVGFFFGAGEARSELLAVVHDQAGANIAAFIESLIAATAQENSRVATFVGVIILVFASTNLFTALQSALGCIWGVTETRYAGFLQLVWVRVLSLGIVALLAVIALVSLALQTILGWLAAELSVLLPETDLLIRFGSQVLTVLVVAVTFVAVHKLLVHRPVSWHAVSVGGLLTAVLIRVAQVLVGLYLRTGAVGSAFGAAGSLVALLLFVYYSMQIFLLGACFTRVYDGWRAGGSAEQTEDEQKHPTTTEPAAAPVQQ